MLLPSARFVLALGLWAWATTAGSTVLIDLEELRRYICESAGLVPPLLALDSHHIGLSRAAFL